MIFTFTSFLLLIFTGVPIVFALGVAATLTLTIVTETPLSIVAQRIYAGLNSFPIMAIPFFVMAGIIMEVGGIARRIVDLATALVGWITGSLFGVAVTTGTGLASISGSGSADTAAISSMLVPEMRKRGYDIDFSAALIASCGSLAPIIPPSIIMVVLATISNISVGAVFLGGIVPGLLIAVALLFAGYIFARRGGPQYRDSEPFSLGRLGHAFYVAIPALTLPIIVVGGIVGGIVTPTEAAALAVVAGLFISMAIYRELTFAQLPQLILRGAAISAAVMMIIATASIFSWLIASQNVPAMLGGWLQTMSDNPIVFLLLANLLLLVVGMFMESVSAILILIPMLMPIAVSYGIDPVHFGVIATLNLSLGLITPPYGICLYVAATVAQRSVVQVSRKVWIPFIPILIVLLLATYIPEIVLWLPNTLLSR